EPAKGDHETDAERWYVDELRRISGIEGVDERVRMLLRDSAASAFSRVVLALAERAALERAAALRAAEAAGEQRSAVAKAIAAGGEGIQAEHDTRQPPLPRTPAREQTRKAS